ncbi:hypothetical protein F7725_006631, partial [Dissostichus mawsoni]
MATELDPGPIIPTMGFFACSNMLPASAVHLPWLSSSSLDTSVSRINSILCSSATAECQHESLIIQSVHHGLHSLDPILLTHRTTLSLMDLSKTQ